MTANLSPAGPVEVRLIGAPADVARIVRLLTDTTQVSDVSRPRPTRTPGLVRVYATVTRRFPLAGGTR